MFELKNKTILILSPEDWGTSLLSKHLYALELSRNNKVYFVHTSPHPKQQNFISAYSINDQLQVLHLKHVVKGIFKLPAIAIDIQNKRIIKKIKDFIGQHIDLVWSFDQSKFQNLNQFNASVSIFHPVDFIEKAVPFITRIANSADFVFSVSKKILNLVNTSTPKHFINHGLDGIFVDRPITIEKPTFIDSKKINVGYVGNLQIKLMDWDALTQTVQLNPNINFVFIGPDKASNIGGNQHFEQLRIIKKFSNTQFTGSLSKEKLKNVLPFFDAFIISYDHKKFPVHVSNSHKILEFLSTGKVIVSNFISTYKDSGLLEMVTDNQFLPEKLKEITQQINNYNTAEKEKARMHYAHENTYQKQIERIASIINS